MKWVIENNRHIKVFNGNIVTFDFDIREAAEIGNLIIVILEIPPNEVMTENVFGVSMEGKLLWQIERTAANSADPANRYLGVACHDQGLARMYNWNGVNSGVDIHTGKVVDARVAK